jgi:hypothetical protein
LGLEAQEHAVIHPLRACVVPQRLRLRAAKASQTMSECGQDCVVMSHNA